MKISHLPVRLAAGAFFLNSGISKVGMDEQEAEGLKQMGTAGVPLLSDIDAKTFGKVLPAAEIAIGAALLAPFIPSWLAGAAMTAFSTGLVNMYLKTPDLTQEDGYRPTADGVAVAKDVMFLGSGLSLVLDSIFSRRRVVKKVRADKIRIKPSRS